MSSLVSAPLVVRTVGLRLGELVRELEPVQAELRGDAEVVVRDLYQDSRRVGPGDLFVARAGARTHGLRYLQEALERGAAAVLVERGSETPELVVPVVEVSNVRWATALAAEALRGHLSRQLRVLGITGTNGKTTTAWLVQHALDLVGLPTARLGTLGFQLGELSEAETLTTPEADDLSRWLGRAVGAGATHLVLEVSSHALDQYRVHGLAFEVAAFTNLTQDHLDYHGSLEAYARAKQRLFCELVPRVSVLNIDDPVGQQIARRCSSALVRYGRAESAELRLLEAEVGADGIRSLVRLPQGTVWLASGLVGAHNLDNLLCAFGILLALEVEPEQAARALAAVPPVPGRLERCDGPEDDIIVLVDYAHTPDALRRVLQAVRRLGGRDLVCVFGCGGDRDPGKRSLMGEAVAQAADRAIVTNDNPRTEDPEQIVSAIRAGLERHCIAYQVIFDRAQAIEQAVLGAAPGDVVLIAGKGHEPYQIFGTTRVPFDDRVQARRALARRRGQS